MFSTHFKDYKNVLLPCNSVQFSSTWWWGHGVYRFYTECGGCIWNVTGSVNKNKRENCARPLGGGRSWQSGHVWSIPRAQTCQGSSQAVQWKSHVETWRDWPGCAGCGCGSHSTSTCSKAVSCLSSLCSAAQLIFTGPTNTFHLGLVNSKCTWIWIWIKKWRRLKWDKRWHYLKLLYQLYMALS